jgi:hypothetical protein
VIEGAQIYRYAANGEWYNSFRVTVYNAVDILIALVQLTVDESLGVSLWGVFVDGRGVRNVVFFDVLSRCNERRSKATRDEEGCRVLWVPDADVTVCI